MKNVAYEEKKFGLYSPRHDKLMGVSVMSNGDGDCCDVRHSLSPCFSWDPLWLVDRKEVAEKAAVTNTEYYNAGYDTPSNNFHKEDLQVVEITITYKVKKK